MRLVILGDPGSGKSSLLRFLAVRWARIDDANLRYTQSLPLLIELRDYNRWKCASGKSFAKYLLCPITGWRCPLIVEWFKRKRRGRGTRGWNVEATWKFFTDWEVTMSQQIDFSAALDAAEQLDPDAQAELVAVLSRRLAERGRERLAIVVAQARHEYAAGQCQPMTAAEIVREALS